MRLVLYDMHKSVADKFMNDDAFEMWCKIKNENKSKAAPAAFYSRKNIHPQNNYLHINFVDTETGEMLFINCLEALHNEMVMHSLYPEFILNGLKRTS